MEGNSLKILAVDDADIVFEELFSPKDIQRLQDEFAKATGVASIITHTNGTPITEPSNFCRLCADIIRKTDKGLANCHKSDAILGRFNPNGPVIQPCSSGGLWDAGAAITVGGKHIANWLIGQVRDETQTEEKMREYARHIEVDEEAVIEAFREVPTMSREQFGLVARSLFTLANQLSNTAYLNVQQARLIAERDHFEVKLTQTAREWQTTFDAVSDVIWLLDKEQRIVRSNKAAERLVQRPCKEIAGKKCWEIAHGLSEPIPECSVRLARESLQRESAESQIGERWFHVSANPILDAEGNYDGCVHILSDINTRKRAEQELEEHRDHLGDLVLERTAELRRTINVMAGREVRMAELKDVIKRLRVQLEEAGMTPIANDPLKEGPGSWDRK